MTSNHSSELRVSGPELLKSQTFAIEHLKLAVGQVDFIKLEHEDVSKLPPNWQNRVEDALADYSEGDLLLLEYYLPDFSIPSIPLLSRVVENYAQWKISQCNSVLIEIAREKHLTIAVADIANNVNYAMYELVSQMPYNFLLIVKHWRTILNNMHHFESTIEELMKSTGVYSDYPSSSDEPIHAVDARRFITAAHVFHALQEQPGRRIAIVNAPAHIRRIKKYLETFDSGKPLAFRRAVYRAMLGVPHRMRTY